MGTYGAGRVGLVMGLVSLVAGCIETGSPPRMHDGGRVVRDAGPWALADGRALSDAAQADGCAPELLTDDRDGDGHGDPETARIACSAPGLVAVSDDCDDADPSVHPGGTETCDGRDDDCNGAVDDGVLRTFYRDADGDGFGSSAMPLQGCTADAGYVATGLDCDDACPTCTPSGTETCDGHDNDCDGAIDDGVLQTFYRDADGDGFGSSAMPLQGCTADAGYVATGTDCDDACRTCTPTGTETCDGHDNDCDGAIDDGVLRIFYRDADGDGFGSSAMPVQACAAGAGYVATGTDCDDACRTCTPTGTETCDGRDNDCDRTVDDGVLVTFYRDADGDGYGDAAATMLACSRPAGYVATRTDCDDADASVRPGATDTCDGRDNDCSGAADGAPAHAWCSLPAQLASLSAVSAWCSAGACAATSCSVGLGNCVPGGACETDLRSSVTHCGACGTRCTWDECRSSRCSVPRHVSVGPSTGCAALDSGSVNCWGAYAGGAPGTGTVIEVAVGESFECFRTTAGEVWCLGTDAYGELGNGAAGAGSAPSRVVDASGTPLSGVAGITAGVAHACARLTSGALLCWGLNDQGQLGDGTTVNRPYAVRVTAGATLLNDVRAVDAGSWHTCAVAGALSRTYCWGDNSGYQLGLVTSDLASAAAVLGAGGASTLDGIASISSGARHTCAVSGAGQALCWGAGGDGRLGTSVARTTVFPTFVTGYASSGARAIVAGSTESCLLTTTNVVYCWGLNDVGGVGDGTYTMRTTPVAVSFASPLGPAETLTSLSGGFGTVCGVTSGDRAFCWGEGSLGQRGDGTLVDSPHAVLVSAP